MNQKQLKVGLVLGAIATVLLFMQLNRNQRAEGASKQVRAEFKDQAEAIAYRCGSPQIDDSTEKDDPAPPITTRWFVYNKAQVKITFIRNGPVNESDPWLPINYVDPASGRNITQAEAKHRLPCM
jgi:hypothetical protein